MGRYMLLVEVDDPDDYFETSAEVAEEMAPMLDDSWNMAHGDNDRIVVVTQVVRALPLTPLSAGERPVPPADFYEEDEPLEKLKAAFDRGEKRLTAQPERHCDWPGCQFEKTGKHQHISALPYTQVNPGPYS